MNLIDLRYIDDLKDLDLDMVDISKPAPEFEPNRQFYFMAKARSWVKKKSEELGRPMTFFTQTFGWQRKYEERVKNEKRAKMQAMKEEIRRQDRENGVYATAGSLALEPTIGMPE